MAEDISKIDDAPSEKAEARDCGTSSQKVPECGTSSQKVRAGHMRFTRSTQRCSVTESCKGQVENMGLARLCLPTVRGTLLSTLLSSCSIFLGLMALGGAEVGLAGIGKLVPITMLLRCLGWGLLFYIPVHLVSMPVLRNYVIWAVLPGEQLTKEHSYAEERHRCHKGARFLPYVLHACWISAYVLIICLHVGEEGHFGMLPIYGLGNLLMMPLGVSLCLMLAPPTVSKSYAFKIGPATILFPIVGFLTVVTAYILLRRLSGPLLGIAMPLLLSTYELIGTSLVCRIFLKEFVTNKDSSRPDFVSSYGRRRAMATWARTRVSWSQWPFATSTLWQKELGSPACTWRARRVETASACSSRSCQVWLGTSSRAWAAWTVFCT